MGVFTIYSDADAGQTAVSNRFIDEYMADANEAELKVYLYLLRQMKAGHASSVPEMADEFNHTEKDILRALRYWEKKGLLALDEDGEGNISGIRFLEIRPAERTRPAQILSITSAMEAPRTAVVAMPAPQPSAKDVPAGSAENQKRAELFFIVEQYIGKPLSSAEMEKINYIADDLHFSDDLIDYLVQYCVGLGKKDFRYIEKVAVSWAQEGISTAKDAQKSVSEGRSGKKNSRKSRKPTANSFGSFQQNQYDFAEFEKQILNS